MQNPEKEVIEVVSLVTAAINPEVQKAAVSRYESGPSCLSESWIQECVLIT
jgi:hypothetical protein